MFNLKDKTPLHQVQIISDNQHAKLPNAGWAVGFEESAYGQNTADKQKKISTKNQFRVRIYNVY